MAKEIKAIQCPKCGSTQNTELKPDYFRCSSCGTEYFLDNNDININYNIKQPPAAVPTARPAVTPGRARFILFIMLVGIVSVIYTIAHVFSGSGAPAANSPAASADNARYSWSGAESRLYLSAVQQPVLFIAGFREYSGAYDKKGYAAFINPVTGTEIKSVKIPAADAGSTIAEFSIKQFSNGDIYFIVNRTSVYHVERNTYGVTDVSTTLFQGIPELASGIATIQPVDNDMGDGFNVFTNDGKNVFYFPLVNKVYTGQTLYPAQQGFKSLLPGNTVKTAFAFSARSFTYPDDKIELIAYQYRDNGGGPKDRVYFRWDDYYGGSGIFTDADPHVKVLIDPSEKASARILSFTDFTPGRLYFEPKLLYYDADNVLITFRPTAALNSPVDIQCLDAHTAAIKFTAALADASGADDAIRYKDGYVLRNRYNTIAINAAGALIKKYETR